MYQFAGPLLFTPLLAWFWTRRYPDHLAIAVMSVLVPVVYAYVIPGVGTNVLRLWESNTRFRLGRFCPHHGFVFGSATSFIALIALKDRAALGQGNGQEDESRRGKCHHAIYLCDSGVDLAPVARV